MSAGCKRPQPPGYAETPLDERTLPDTYTDVNPRWSHDGKRIAFLRATADRRHQLTLLDVSNERVIALLEPELIRPDRPYSSTLCRYASPDTLAWSPDDRQIAFQRVEWSDFENRERLPGTGIWAISLATGRVVPLAIHPNRYRLLFYYYHAPQWSPDGRYLAFVGEGINGQRAIFIRPIPAQKAQDVAPCFDNYEDSDWPVWEPSGANAVIFRRGLQRAPGIAKVETLRRILPGSADSAHSGEWWRINTQDFLRTHPPTDRNAGEPVPRTGHFAWSPNGRRLAFTLTPDANDFTRYELWVVDRDGRNARRVGRNDGHGCFAPVWIGNDRLGALSPNGARFDVVTVALQDGAIRRLGTIDSADCDWSPDRRRIVYASPSYLDEDALTGPATLRFLETGVTPAD